jgi:hypothetical protein
MDAIEKIPSAIAVIGISFGSFLGCLGGHMRHMTEMQRIAAAEEAAQRLIDQMSPEVVERLGEANLISDLTHEFLMSGLPSRELQEQMAGQIQADGPTDDTPPEN